MDPNNHDPITIEKRRGIPIFERGENGTCVQRGLFSCGGEIHLAPAEEIEIDGVGPILAHRIITETGGFAGHFLDQAEVSNESET